MLLIEQLTLAFLCLGCSVHWARYAWKAPAAAGSAAIAGGSDGSGAAAATAAPWLNLELCGALVAATALLLLSHTRWWGRARLWVAAGVRLAAFFATPPSLGCAPLLSAEPAGALLDGLRVLFGSKAWRLFLVGTALPLGPVAHLFVHTLCLARALVDEPSACAMLLLDADMPAERIAAFHTLIEALGTAGILHGFPPGGRKVQCEAALNTLCIFLGWLVPIYLTLRRCQCAAQQQRRALAHRQTAMDRFRFPAFAAEPAGPADTPQHSGSSIGSSLGAASPALQPGSPVGRQAHIWRSCLRRSVDDAVAWLLDNVFLDNAPPGLAPMAWWILAVLSWMAGCLLAILAS